MNVYNKHALDFSCTLFKQTVHQQRCGQLEMRIFIAREVMAYLLYMHMITACCKALQGLWDGHSDLQCIAVQNMPNMCGKMLNISGGAQSTSLTNGQMLPTMLMGQNLTVSMMGNGIMIMGEASNATVTMPNIMAMKARSVGFCNML